MIIPMITHDYPYDLLFIWIIMGIIMDNPQIPNGLIGQLLGDFGTPGAEGPTAIALSGLSDLTAAGSTGALLAISGFWGWTWSNE